MSNIYFAAGSTGQYVENLAKPVNGSGPCTVTITSPSDVMVPTCSGIPGCKMLVCGDLHREHNGSFFEPHLGSAASFFTLTTNNLLRLQRAFGSGWSFALATTAMINALGIIYLADHMILELSHQWSPVVTMLLRIILLMTFGIPLVVFLSPELATIARHLNNLCSRTISRVRYLLSDWAFELQSSPLATPES